MITTRRIDKFAKESFTVAFRPFLWKHLLIFLISLSFPTNTFLLHLADAKCEYTKTKQRFHQKSTSKSQIDSRRRKHDLHHINWKIRS